MLKFTIEYLIYLSSFLASSALFLWIVSRFSKRSFFESFMIRLTFGRFSPYSELMEKNLAPGVKDFDVFPGLSVATSETFISVFDISRGIENIFDVNVTAGESKLFLADNGFYYLSHVIHNQKSDLFYGPIYMHKVIEALHQGDIEPLTYYSRGDIFSYDSEIVD